MKRKIWDVYLIGMVVGTLLSMMILMLSREDYSYAAFAGLLLFVMVAAAARATRVLADRHAAACVTLIDVRKRLQGHPESRLDGENGLIEATMNEIGRLKALARGLPHTCTGNHMDGTWRDCDRCSVED